jgi:hypothetical protein
MSTIARIDSLTVAMALAPGVYARNRMFDFFREGAVRRARTRSAILRGIIPQLGRATSVTLTCDGEPRTPAGEPVFVLRYSVPELRMSRVVELSPTELAALRLMASRVGLACLPVEASDRTRVEAALARLLDDRNSKDLARAATAHANADE